MSNSPAISDAAGVVQALRRITKAVHEFSKAVDRQFGITGPQLWALRTIQDRNGCSAGDLAERLCVHPSTVTGVIQRLADKNLIERQKRADDRRAVWLTLTDEGRTLLERAPYPAQGQLVQALRQMPEEDVTKLRQVLDGIVNHMELGDISARFFFSDD